MHGVDVFEQIIWLKQNIFILMEIILVRTQYSQKPTQPIRISLTLTSNINVPFDIKRPLN